MTATFSWLSERGFLIDLDSAPFAEHAAYFLSELNAGHAFREGNGRTQLVFLKLLTANAGRSFEDGALDPGRTLAAMIASFSGELRPLTQLIADIIS